MFYSAHGDVLPCQLVGIELAEDQTTEKLFSKVMLETVLPVQGFHSSALVLVCFFSLLPSSSDLLLKVESDELLTNPCRSSAMNNTATKSKHVICLYKYIF